MGFVQAQGLGTAGEKGLAGTPQEMEWDQSCKVSSETQLALMKNIFHFKSR